MYRRLLRRSQPAYKQGACGRGEISVCAHAREKGMAWDRGGELTKCLMKSTALISRVGGTWKYS